MKGRIIDFSMSFGGKQRITLEIDSDFRTPAAENLVYQNMPAVALGFPMLLLTAVAPEKPVMVIIILAVYFAVMNIILFREKLFRRRKTTPGTGDGQNI